MYRLMLLAAALLLIFAEGPSLAADEPVYEPASDWVELDDTIPEEAGGSPLLRARSVTRVDGDVLQTFAELLYRGSTPQAVQNISRLTAQWLPEKGNLRVHEISIIRGDEVIDILEAGQQFTVLRREEMLEKSLLTGLLTATLTVEGLRVGDVLRVRMTTELSDPALGGNVQGVQALATEAVQIGEAESVLLWPQGQQLDWQVLNGNPQATVTEDGAMNRVAIPLPLDEGEDMPRDAPVRFQMPPLLEYSTFGSWADVSSTFAPQYAAEGLQLPSDLEERIAEIRSRHDGDAARAAAALRIVQDDIQYLMNGLNGGNYVPQAPAETWRQRLGDCKAVTLLLLAMLEELGIEAEPVLAHSRLGRMIPQRLPSALAFDHVLVSARIGDRTAWLDGTGAGTREADIFDPPPFGYVLPLRTGGAQPFEIETQMPSRPQEIVNVRMSMLGSVDMPLIADVEVKMLGPVAIMVAEALRTLGPDQTKELIREALLETLPGSGLVTDTAFAIDEEEPSVTLTGTVLRTRLFSRENQEWSLALSQMADDLRVRANRTKAAWRDIPVVTSGLQHSLYTLVVELPEGADYALEGDADFTGTIMGRHIDRDTRLQDNIVKMTERVRSDVLEVDADDLPAAREAGRRARADLPKVVAISDVPRMWDLVLADAPHPQIQRIDEIFDAAEEAYADDPVHVLTTRMRYYYGVRQIDAALEYVDKVLELEPSVDMYTWRSALNHFRGDDDAALRDARLAFEFDPSSYDAREILAERLILSGDVDAGVALLDEQIELGGSSEEEAKFSKADFLGEAGRGEESVALFDELLDEGPVTPKLLNARCWIKGLNGIDLDGAIDDCNRAIELARDPAAYFESRALVWLRMGEPAKTLEDAERALDLAPDRINARWLRGLALTELGRPKEAEPDFYMVREYAPPVLRTLERFGLIPEG
ncbi:MULTISPECIES: DUF3857 domain-containing protein [Pacificimonas]|nr:MULTISPECIES: DUF3857 domain-containing protein [Pacificimonas]MBZ6379897.1 DUF3857 domain-containing protein [Pacificimonas aurantium]